MSDVRHHADDLAHTRLAVFDRDLLAERVASAQEAVDEDLVQDDDAGTPGAVGLGEDAPAPHRDAHRVEVARADAAVLGGGTLRRRRGGFAPQHGETAAGIFAAERKVVRDPDAADPGERFDARHELLEEPGPRLGRVVRAGKRDIHHERSLAQETGVDALQRREAARRQAGADEQDQRHRNLRHHQGALADGAGARAVPAGALQRRANVGARRVQRRQQAGDEAAGQRRGQREREHTKVERRLFRARQARRARGHEQAKPPGGEHAAEDGAGQGQDQALGEQLCHELPPRRPECVSA